MKKTKSLAYSLIIIIQLLICVLTYWRYASMQQANIAIDKFYLKNDETEAYYLDSTFDSGARTLISDSFDLAKGSYIVTIDYDCNLSPDAIYGTYARIYSRHKGIVVSPMENYILLPSTTNQLSFNIFVPYDDSSSTLRIVLENNGPFLDDENGLKFIKVKDAQITFDSAQSARYYAGRVLTIFFILDLILLFFIRHTFKIA